MKLDKKKVLAARVLKVGKGRIKLDDTRFAELKEAITKQDIRDLHSQGIIQIKEKKGRKKIVRRKTKKRAGKIKKTVNKRKQEYVKITKKLRYYIKELKNQDRITKEDYEDLRKKIRARTFKSKSQLKGHLTEK